MPLRIDDQEVHGRINAFIQRTGLTAGQHWASGRNRKMRNLYQVANTRVINGKTFFGYGSWERYLEKKHRVVPIDQRTWSNERLHMTIALLALKYPPEEKGWTHRPKAIIHGRSLKQLYERAYSSNRDRPKVRQKFFGKGSWEKYLAWVRQKYR